MSVSKKFLVSILGCLLLTGQTVADDAGDVESAVLALNTAANQGDVKTIVKYIADSRTLFNIRGRMLSHYGKMDADGLKSIFEAGLKIDRRWKNLEVEVYGDAAVVTGYHIGRNTNANGGFSEGNRRVTEVWTKMDSGWKRVHRHASQLEPLPRRIEQP